MPTPMSTPTPIVELSGVNMTFGEGSGDKNKVLDDINLTVNEHDVMALLGPFRLRKVDDHAHPVRPDPAPPTGW